VIVVEVNGYKIEPGANLYGANLEEANLREARLTGVNLTDANLYSANLARANLSGATTDEVTVTWPDGFDPVAAGVVDRQGGWSSDST
jgi:hypothetical protein